MRIMGQGASWSSEGERDFGPQGPEFKPDQSPMYLI